MNTKTSRQRQPERRTLKRSTLIMMLGGLLAFSIFLGITAGAMGVGSIYPQLNSIAQPIACPGQTMSHVQQISEIGTATYYAAKWFCVDEKSGERSEVSSNTVALLAGPMEW